MNYSFPTLKEKPPFGYRGKCYGDISPNTDLGQMLASIIMVMGYGIIAVPTGIVTIGLSRASDRARASTRSCPHCSSEGHERNALFCKDCGGDL